MENDELVKILRQRVDKAGSQSALARELRVSRQDVAYALLGIREVSPQLAAALGFEKTTVFVPKK